MVFTNNVHCHNQTNLVDKKIITKADVSIINTKCITVSQDVKALKDKKEEKKKSIWDMIPLYTSLIQTSIWIIFLIIMYLYNKKRVNSILDSLVERIRNGSSLEMGSIKVGEGKPLITNTEQLLPNDPSKKVYGNPDHFTTLFKVVTGDLMKSTKAMELSNGCVVQVTTERLSADKRWSVAETITFVPNAKIIKDTDEGYTQEVNDNDIGYHLESHS